MNLNIDTIDEDYNKPSIINDLMVFPDNTIIAWDDYDPITYVHLGNHCHIVKPEDEEYLAILVLYNKQNELENKS